MLTHDPAALKLLLTDELYLLKADRKRVKTAIREAEKKEIVKEAVAEPEVAAVAEPVAAIPEPEAAPEKITFAGSLANGCLVILNEPGFDTLSPETETALGKIFQARKTSLDECGLVNLANTPVTFPQIRDDVQPKTIIMLGVDTNALDLDKLAYNTPLIRDDIKILYSYKMSDMLSDDGRKKLFWEGVKLIL